MHMHAQEGQVALANRSFRCYTIYCPMYATILHVSRTSDEYSNMHIPQ